MRLTAAQLLRRPCSLLLLGLVPLASTGCHTTPHAEHGGADVHTEGGGEEEPDEDAIEERAWTLDQARLDLRSAEMSAELAMRKAHARVLESEQTLDEAMQSLETFRGLEREHSVAEARLGLERMENRAVESQMELEELEAMYAADEFAGKTKELVLERGRRSLRMSQAMLELQRQELAMLENRELPQKERSLVRKVEAAERGLEEARFAAEQTELDNERKLRKAQREVEEAQAALEEVADA